MTARKVGKPKYPGPLVAAGTPLTFTTTLAGDEVENAGGTFYVKQKSVGERWLELVPTTHRSHAYPTRVSEFDFNRGGYSLVTPASE